MSNPNQRKSANVNEQALYNILATAILSGLNFFTIPIFTRILGAEQFGKYSVYHSWILILSCFMGLQTSSCTGVGLYKYKDNYYKFRSSILLFSTLLSLGIVGLGIVFVQPISGLLGYSPATVIVLFLTALAEYIVGFVTGTMTYEKKAKKNCLLSIFMAVMTVGLSLFLTNVFERDSLYLSRVYGVFIPYAVVAVILWLAYFLPHPSGLVKEYCKFGLVLGTPLVLHKLSQSVLNQSDRIMMQYMGISDRDVGIYSFFYSYTNIVMVLLTALNTSWCPFYYDDLSAENTEAIRKKSRNYIDMFTTIVCGFLLLSREVTYLFASEEYWSGMPIIPVLVSATYCTFLYQFAVNFELFNQRTGIVAAATLGASVLNIILNALMIPSWGIYGAAIATSLSYAGLVVVHFFAANRIKSMKFHAKIRDFIPGLLVVALVSVLFYVLADYWLIRWVLGAMLGVRLLIQVIRRKSIF